LTRKRRVLARPAPSSEADDCRRALLQRGLRRGPRGEAIAKKGDYRRRHHTVARGSDVRVDLVVAEAAGVDHRHRDPGGAKPGGEVVLDRLAQAVPRKTVIIGGIPVFGLIRWLAEVSVL
jgi:hypothetical protein